MGAFKAAETSWPTYYDRITPNGLKSNQVGEPVSCVHHWDRTKTGGMGQRRPGKVRVTNAERKDPELTEAGTGVVSFGKGGMQALWQGRMGSGLKAALESWRKCL